jgi:xanthine dehydrogenase accessory factor
VALATVIRTWGSAPRPVGSQLAVDEAGAMVGSVSGGCVEGGVVHQALQAIADGEARLLGYGVTDERAWEVGLACGGRIELFLQPVGPADGKPELLERLVRARGEGRPVALVTDLVMGLQTLVFESVVHGGFGLEEPVLAAARDCLAADRSAVLEAGEEGRVFVHVFVPPPRLLVVGGVHIAQALVPMARLAGYQVTVIDPRRSFAAAERFPDTQVVAAWPDEALAAAGLDGRSAVVTLSHDPKLDDPALAAALRAPVFYIGALGSRRTHARRLERLRDLGVPEAELARVHGPVGLRIGAETPAEIAVSILAEIIAVRRGGAARGDPAAVPA